MHKCKDCVRYHPRAVGNCDMAKSWANLEKRYGFTLAVVDCPHYLAPEVVFPAEWTSEDMEEEKPKRKPRRKKKVTLDCGCVGECECGGDD